LVGVPTLSSENTFLGNNPLTTMDSFLNLYAKHGIMRTHVLIDLLGETRSPYSSSVVLSYPFISLFTGSTEVNRVQKESMDGVWTEQTRESGGGATKVT
jgi:hypothetical protein